MLDMMSRTLRAPRSLEIMDYGQKSCLHVALGIFIQYNSHLQKAGVQNYA